MQVLNIIFITILVLYIIDTVYLLLLYRRILIYVLYSLYIICKAIYRDIEKSRDYCYLLNFLFVYYQVFYRAESFAWIVYNAFLWLTKLVMFKGFLGFDHRGLRLGL